MKSITLIGYMCVGKTTVGKALAKSLGCTFYDLDWYIEERFHSKVSQIFAEKGEEKFENIVLSCGGGTPCFFDNMDYLNSVSETFYLKASPETLCRHIAMCRGDRPLLKGKSPEEIRAFVEQQLQAREPFYEKAKHVVDINVLDSFEKIDDIAKIIRHILNI